MHIEIGSTELGQCVNILYPEKDLCHILFAS